MPRKPKNVSEEQMARFNKMDAYIATLHEIERDFSLSEEMEFVASTFAARRIDITNQEQLDLFVRQNSQNGNLESVGFQAIENPTKENILAFFQQFCDTLRNTPKDNPIYNFSLLAEMPGYCQALYAGTQSFQISTEKTEGPNVKIVEAKQNFIKAQQEKIDRVCSEIINHNNVLLAIINEKTVEEKLQDEAIKEEKAALVMEVVAGRANVLLGRHEFYQQLKDTPLTQYEGIPMGGLALLAANSRDINRNVVDGSSGVANTFVPQEPYTPEEQQIMNAVEKNQELMNIGGKMMDSFFGGSDVSRMGGRAESIINSRIALNEAMTKYMSGDKASLAHLIADSFDGVYSQLFYTSENLDKKGVIATSEIYKALDTMFAKDPELQTLSGISPDQMKVLKGASATYDLIADPRTRIADAYKLDKGPNTPERKDAIENILFAQMMEKSLALEISTLNSKLRNEANDAIETDEYSGLLAKFDEYGPRVFVKDALAGNYINDHLIVPEVFNIMNDPAKFAEYKESLLEFIRKSPEYNNFLNMEKDELFKTDFSAFGKTLAANQAKEKEEEAYKQEAAVTYPRTKEIQSLWMEVVNDFSLPQNITALANDFAQYRLDITDPAQLEMFTQKDPESGEYKPIGIPAAQDLSKESMVEFVQALESRMRSTNATVYAFNTLATKLNSISTYTMTENGNVEFFNVGRESEVPEEPAPVANPGWFKSTTNRWFGWFKSEVTDYNNYVAEKTTHDNIVSENRKKKAACSKYEKLIAKNAKYNKFVKGMDEAIENNKTAEQKLMDLVAKEKAEENCIDLVAGRTKKLLGRHKNYEDLSKTELKDIPGIPMEGLALLVANSVSINKSIIDASTPVGQSEYHPSVPFTDFEKNFIDTVKKSKDVINAAGKVMESFYCGKDIKRMGDRATSAVISRTALNDAAEKYLEGDEKALVDMINDSIEVLYESSNTMGAKANTPQAKAISEMYKALDKMFTQDPYLREQINISDEKLNVIKGASKIADLLANPMQQKLDACRNDQGPGTASRQEMLDNLLFKNYLYNAVSEEAIQLQNTAGDIFASKYMSNEYQGLYAKLGNREPANLMAEGVAYCQVNEIKCSELLSKFAEDGFNMEKVKADMLADIKKNPRYDELLKMDSEDLYRENFADFTKQIFKTQLKERKAQAKALAENELKQDKKKDLAAGDAEKKNEEVIPGLQ